MKIAKLNGRYFGKGRYGHYCPGCRTGHDIAVEERQRNGAIWTFNGDMSDKPTFSPSINLRWGSAIPGETCVAGGVCHYFITDGKIIYCSDSTHELRGQTVDLPEIPSGIFVSSREQ